MARDSVQGGRTSDQERSDLEKMLQAVKRAAGSVRDPARAALAARLAEEINRRGRHLEALRSREQDRDAGPGRRVGALDVKKNTMGFRTANVIQPLAERRCQESHEDLEAAARVPRPLHRRFC